MRYVIRKLEGDCWIDAVGFTNTDKIESKDAGRAIAERVADGAFLLPSVFCLVERLNNGRERLIGNEVCIGRDGKIM